MACDADVTGIVFTCNPDGSAELVIDATALTDTTSLLAYADAPLSIRNSGHFEFDGGGGFLTLMGKPITYQGDGASISAPHAIAINAYSDGPGLATFVLNDVISAQVGLYVKSNDGGALDIEMIGGSITADVGLQLKQAVPGRIDIAVRAGAIIEGKQPIVVDNAGTTRLLVAGKLIGLEGSSLGAGDSELELHPGYAISGPIQAVEGENTLIWGGSGEGHFSLASIGSHLVDGVETGQFLGFQHFRKTGLSNWSLTGALAHPFDLDLEQGTLTFDGARAEQGLITVRSAGRLAGAGTVGDLDVFGSLAPRGTLFAGDVVFHPGSLLEVTTSAAGADLIQVTSVGDLGGTTLRVVPSAGYHGGRPILLTNTPLATGNHFIAVRSITPRYRPELTYTDQSVLLDLVATGASFAGFASNPTEVAIAELLDAMGPAAPYYDMLDTMAPEDVSRLLVQLSGSDLAVTGDVLLQNTGLLDATIIGRLQQQAGMLGQIDAPLGYTSLVATPTSISPTGVWGKLVAGNAASTTTASGATALFGGADTTLSNGATAGLLVGLGQSAVSSGSTVANSTDLSIGTYAAADLAGLHIRLGTSLTNHTVTSSRRIQSPGVDTRLTADYSIVTAQVFAELAQQFDLGPLTAELFGDFGYARNFTSAYTEQGGAGALSVAAQSSDAIETQLGARFSQRIAMQTTLLTLTGSLAWKHRVANTPGTLQSFAGSATFSMPGGVTTTNGLVAGIDVHLDQSAEAGLDVSYRLELGDTGTAQTISARYAHLF
jgi:uncharacterized protein with beta-barrel porin domain